MPTKPVGRPHVWEQYLGILPMLLLPILAGLLLAVVALVRSSSEHRAEREASRDQNSATTAAVKPAPEKKVFNSPLPGQWYDADKDKLAAEIDGYLAKVESAPLDNVHALILPHAGYRYSGQVAAYGIKQIQGRKFSRVVVMGPSHHVPMQNIASVPDVTHYATPLGEVPLDVDFIAALLQRPEFKVDPRANEPEHSVQIEIPLLQRALAEFKLVPIVVGQLDANAARSMAKILSGLIDPETLVIASSDFTHYGTNYGYMPFKDDVQKNLEKLDMGAWDVIQNKDMEGFAKYVDRTGATICGRCPIEILLAMVPRDIEAHLLKYDTSGRMTNDTTNSVSYLAVAFTGAWRKGEPVAPKTPEAATIPDEDKTQLLRLARGTLESYLKKGKIPMPEELGVKITPPMCQIMGAFVTLKKNGQLRGCIGEIFPMRELYKAVMEHAVDAAINDPRFPRVKAAELPALHFEISALTQPSSVPSYKDIVIGKHGMVIRKNGRTAVFLPQVAPEEGWGIEETLTHLSQKAGLPSDAWKEGASFTVFEAIVFAEKEK